MGTVATPIQLTSAAIAVGQAVACVPGASSVVQGVTLATTAAIAAGGLVLGIALALYGPSPAGLVYQDIGAVDPTVKTLGAGAAGPVGVDATGNPQRWVSGPVIGTCTTSGAIVLVPGGGGSGVGPSLRLILNGGSPFPQEPYLNILPTWTSAASATDVPASQWTALQLGGPIVSPIVSGITVWYPGGTTSGASPVIYSAIFAGTTTSGAHTSVQLGLNIPLPNQTAVTGMPTPPTGGLFRVRYDVDVASTTLSTPVGACFSGYATYAVKSSTTVTGPSAQTLAVGIVSGGALPSGWSLTPTLTSGQIQFLLTTDGSDTYNGKLTTEWGYT